MLSARSPVLRPPPIPSRPPAISRSLAYRRVCFPDPQSGVEEGLPSSQDNLLTVPRPLRRRIFSVHSRTKNAFHGLHPSATGSAPSSPPTRDGCALRRCRLRFMLRTGQLFHPASHPASQPRTGVSLPGTLVSPRTGLTPAGCPELVAQLRHNRTSCHSARTTGRTARSARRRSASSVPVDHRA